MKNLYSSILLSLFTLGITSSSISLAQTSFTPQTLAALSTSQNGYSFSSWQTGMSCTIEDKGRIVSIKAAVGPTITMYDSITAAPTNYQGTWTGSNIVVANDTVIKKDYTASLGVYTTVAAALSGGAYTFSVTTTGNVVHNIALFPNGFYVSKSNNSLYLPGC